MTPIPLADLALDRRSHLSALWWLGLLYRRPRTFKESLEELPLRSQLAAGLRVWLHQLPYLLLSCVVGRYLLFGLLDLETTSDAQDVQSLLEFHAEQLAVGIAAGIALGIAFGMALGIAAGIGEGIAHGIAVGIAVGIASGIGGGITFGIAAGIVSGIAAGIAVLRLYYLPAQALFLWPRPRGTWYRYHPVAWDDLCSIPFPGLDRLLVARAEQDPAGATLEIERLIDTYPSQRHQALRAQATLLARRAAKGHLARLDETLATLPEGNKGFLTQTRQLRDQVHEISALQTRLDTVDRPGLREPLARLLVREIEVFHQQIAGFHQPLQREFRKAAKKWLAVAEAQLAEARAVQEKEPTRQVFRAGDPVDRDNEAFVPRDSITGEIESQVMLATGCPGLVLYGRRRTGKSTILGNLHGFLPPKVRVAGISMQDPAASTSLDDLVHLLVTKVREGAGLDGDAWPGTQLSSLFSALATTNDHLASKDRRLLLTIDEYENLDRKIGEGVFPIDLLDTIREFIQSHRHITWIFAGSHQITELPNAEWASYLVSARTVEVGPFTPAETRLLLTEPLKYSTLWPKDDPTRPHFDPGFWGEGGIERIHAEAGGWPHLVQLIAETIVDLLNDDQRTQVDDEILERALDKAIVRGHTVLHQLMRGESTLPGEWDYLSAFRTCDSQPPPSDDTLARSLRHRLLITEGGDAWHLRVPLMHRWLRKRG